MHFKRMQRSQAAIDFMTSYGLALLLIAISIFVVLQLGIFNYSTSSPYCYSTPGFTCVADSLNTTGGLTLIILQSTGGTINVTGAACASAPNATTSGPQSGNVKVKAYSGASSFYPNNKLSTPLVMAPGAKVALYVNCYNGGGLANGAIGSTYVGYVWLNYTYSSLPSTYVSVSRIFSMNVKYT